MKIPKYVGSGKTCEARNRVDRSHCNRCYGNRKAIWRRVCSADEAAMDVIADTGAPAISDAFAKSVEQPGV